MKFINNRLTLVVAAVFCCVFFTNAQEIIKDSVKPKKVSTAPKRLKVDGIVAVVGDYTILDSDIDKMFLELSQNASVKDITLLSLSAKYP